jgi:hypothetical protein
MFAGDEERVHGAVAQLRALAVETRRDLDGFGLDYVAVRASAPEVVIAEADRWRAAGGTHFSVVSMGAGRDSIDAHVDFFARIADGLGLAVNASS